MGIKARLQKIAEQKAQEEINRIYYTIERRIRANGGDQNDVNRAIEDEKRKRKALGLKY